ncbi:MAG: hypothetical protein KGY54_13930 [Oleiphilaceae bacterium]|nr:hypothetical protein [Oleiphilaceae bacterium]
MTFINQIFQGPEFMNPFKFRVSLAAPVVFLAIGFSGRAAAFDLTLTDPQLEWVGEKIFLNECAGRQECLVHWNEGEAFPSLGIGHFIWYPTGVDAPFVESFPALVDFMEVRSVAIPSWLAELEPRDAPWPDRPVFLALGNTEQVRSLRQLLNRTRGVQAEFMFKRARVSLGRIMSEIQPSERPAMERKLKALIATPGGVYTLMDYVNFKGEGLSPRESYQDEGWGLLQVLREIPADNDDILAAFRLAAANVLTRRAENAPKAIEKRQWLAGWLKRLNTYRNDPG